MNNLEMYFKFDQELTFWSEVYMSEKALLRGFLGILSLCLLVHEILSQ